MMKTYAYIFLLLFVIGCQKSEDKYTANDLSNNELWLIPKAEVLYLNGEKDRIQSIDKPEFIPINESTVKPDDKVLVVHIDGETKVYPIRIMDVHEIVNDHISDYYYSVTYCPLTASGMLWNREFNGEITEFGVSGMLYNNNLMPYDRRTESIWLQMETKCVHGNFMGNIPETGAILETKFSAIASAYPEALILDHSTCDSISCKGTNYYKNDPIDGGAIDLPADQLYFGYAKNDKLLLFNHELFNNGTVAIITNFQGSSLVVCGNKNLHFFTAFQKDESSNINNFSAIQNEFPIILKDDIGNKYDLFGEIIDGPGKGGRLKTVNAYNARTFAWELFFKAIEVYEK